MQLEIFIFFQIVVIGMFMAAFYTKQEILWGITTMMAGILMITSWSIEYVVYQFNQTLGAYDAVFITQNYPYLSGINFLFFSLSIVLGMFDVFDKYGSRFASKPKKGEEGPGHADV